MIRQGDEPLGTKELGRLLHRRPGQAVDDARVTRMFLPQQPEQLPPRLVLRLDPILDVGPVEARHELPGLAERQSGGDLRAGLLGRGGGHRDPGHRGPALVQHGQGQVVGAEIVAPLGHAVCLVDGEQRHRAAVEQPEGRLGPQSFRRQVEQVEFAVQERVLDPAALVGILGRVEEACPHAEHGQRVNLVLHERDQRRDDHARALAHQRGDLVAQRLTAAGRHQGDSVAAAADVLDDLLLLAAEGVVAEHAVQHLGRRFIDSGQAHAAILRAAAVTQSPNRCRKYGSA